MRRGDLGNDDIVGLRQTRKAGRDIGASRGISDVICIEILTCGGGVSRAQFPGLGGLCVPDLEAVVWELATALAGRSTAGGRSMSGPTIGGPPDSKQRVSSISRRRNARGLVLTRWERPRFELSARA